MIYIVVWAVCGLLALSFFWEVLKLAAVPAIGTLVVGVAGFLALYYGLQHIQALLCAAPWVADAALWAILPVSGAVYWLTMRGGQAARG